MNEKNNPAATNSSDTPDKNGALPPEEKTSVEEIGGPKGPDPTRFGDWSVNGRCIDF